MDPAYLSSGCGSIHIAEHISDPTWLCAPANGHCQPPASALDCEDHLQTACGQVEARARAQDASWVCYVDPSQPPTFSAETQRTYLPSETVDETGARTSHTWVPAQPQVRQVSNDRRIESADAESTTSPGLPPLLEDQYTGRIDTCEEYAFRATQPLSGWMDRYKKRGTSPIDGWLDAKSALMRAADPPRTTRWGTPLYELDLPPGLEPPSDDEWGRWFDGRSLLAAWDRATSTINYRLGAPQSGNVVIARNLGWHRMAEEVLVDQAGYSLEQLERIQEQLAEFERLLGELGFVHRAFVELALRERSLQRGIDPDAALTELATLMNPRELLVFTRMGESLAHRFLEVGPILTRNQRWVPVRAGVLGDPNAPYGRQHPDDRPYEAYDQWPPPTPEADDDIASETGLSRDPGPGDPTLETFSQDVQTGLDDRIVQRLVGLAPATTLTEDQTSALMVRRPVVIRRLNEIYDDLAPVCLGVPDTPCMWSPRVFVEALRAKQSHLYGRELARCRTLTGGAGIDRPTIHRAHFSRPPIPDPPKSVPQGTPPAGAEHPDRASWIDPAGHTPWAQQFDFDYGLDLSSMRRLFTMKRFYDVLSSAYESHMQKRARGIARLRKHLELDGQHGVPTTEGRDLSESRRGTDFFTSAFSYLQFRDDNPPIGASSTGGGNDPEAKLCSSQSETSEDMAFRVELGFPSIGIEVFQMHNDQSVRFDSTVGGDGVTQPIPIQTGLKNIDLLGNTVDLALDFSVGMSVTEAGAPQYDVSASRQLTFPSVPGLTIGLNLASSVAPGVRAYQSLMLEALYRVPIPTFEQVFACGPVSCMIALGVALTPEARLRLSSEQALASQCDDGGGGFVDMAVYVGMASSLTAAVGVGVPGIVGLGIRAVVGILNGGFDFEQINLKGPGDTCDYPAIADAACQIKPCTQGGCTDDVCYDLGRPPPLPGCTQAVCLKEGTGRPRGLGYTCAAGFFDSTGVERRCIDCYAAEGGASQLTNRTVSRTSITGTFLGGRVALFFRLLFAEWEQELFEIPSIVLVSSAGGEGLTSRVQALLRELEEGTAMQPPLNDKWLCDADLFAMKGTWCPPASGGN